jgi:hypothetical protein
MDSEHLQRLHDEAVARGQLLYRDPRTGLYVMTAKALKERGYCCENGCRHCPFGYVKP